MIKMFKRKTWPLLLITFLIICVIVQPVSASLSPTVSQTGKISWSIDGLGTTSSTGIIQVEKPAGATVRSAYLGSVNHGSLNSGDIKIDGTDVVWTTGISSGVSDMQNYWGDVTSLVRTKIDAAPAGRIDLTITEASPYDTEGELLVVIFNDPAQVKDNTIVLMFGSQQTAGDNFNISLAEPIDLTDPDFGLDFSLASAYSYQGYTGSGQQVSIVDVNGQRMTSSAGGADDAEGIPSNGNLITVGGLGDSTANPADPNALPNGNQRYDDELYSLLPFVHAGDTQIMVHSQNPTSDDNLPFAGVFIRSATAVVGQGVILSPASATGSAGTTHTLTATVLNDRGQPFAGKLVTFNVTSGPNAGKTGSVTTDADGKAQYTYADTSAGNDTISASFVDNTENIIRSNEAVMVWTSPSTPTITAGFYAFGHVGQAPYSVRFLDQSAGSPTAWHWDFGDGTTSTEQSPTHVYNRTGSYNVALTVSNDQVSDTAIQYRCVIVNSVPVANFTANATGGRTPFTVQFTDQSTGATEYQWQFGDGTTSTEQNPIHTYTQVGTYTVTLVASGADYGSVYTQKPGYITVTDPPTVGFSTNVSAGFSPLAVQFNDSTIGSVQYYYWQFGDGATSFDRNPVHVYNAAGKYTVSLYAIGSNGTQVKTIDDCINVTDPVVSTPVPTITATVTPVPTEQNLPAANFTVTPDASGSLAVQVVDTSVNATSVRYDLGDGTSTAYRIFQYTYAQAGTYTIKQTATGAAGSSVKTVEVTVPAVAPTPTITFPPIGGDQGWYTIHCNVDGATVTFDETSMGTIADGILKVQVYTTGTPFRTYTVQKDGYSTVSGAITTYPGKDQNVDITVTLTPGYTATPYNGPHTIPGTLQAEDYDLGGEGVAYHDTTAGNEGGVYRQDDVDIETLDTDGSPNIGWIRAGEWLAYTVNVGSAGTYDAGFRVASSHAGSSVRVYLDDGTTPIATVNIPNTGDWPVFQTVPVPVTLPAGQHRLILAFPTDYVNINWISFPPRP
jgi:PKD repeat protein